MKNLKIIKSKISKVKLGKNCKIIEPVNLYECSIGKNVFIGPFVEIQKNTKIGDNTRIQSHTFVCEKVNIGSNCFISHGVMFINDLFKKGKVNRNSNFLKWIQNLKMIFRIDPKNVSKTYLVIYMRF